MPTNAIRLRRLLLLAAVAVAGGCGHSSSPGPSPQPCAYAVTASPASFTASGGTGVATVATTAACAWSARADAGWLTFTSGATGTGNGTAAFTVSSNADATARTGTLTVADQSIAIRQDAAAVVCTYRISPASASMSKDAGTGTIAVTAEASCSWTAESSAPWLALTSGQGTGNGTVTYAVSRNLEIAGRSATIRVGGQTFALMQSGDVGGCQYSVAPIEFSPCMSSVELASQVTTRAECPWTAESGASWLTITSGRSGSGSGTVRFRIGDNYDAPRSGVVMIRWPTPTEGQNLRIAQAGCHYAVSRDAFSFAATGGTATFDVIQQSEPYTCGGPTQDACVWTARSDSAWITITSSMPRSGDNPVSFTVGANGSTAARSGTITVRDRVVRVTQPGR